MVVFDVGPHRGGKGKRPWIHAWRSSSCPWAHSCVPCPSGHWEAHREPQCLWTQLCSSPARAGGLLCCPAQSTLLLCSVSWWCGWDSSPVPGLAHSPLPRRPDALLSKPGRFWGWKEELLRIKSGLQVETGSFLTKLGCQVTLHLPLRCRIILPPPHQGWPAKSTWNFLDTFHATQELRETPGSWTQTQPVTKHFTALMPIPFQGSLPQWWMEMATLGGVLLLGSKWKVKQISSSAFSFETYLICFPALQSDCCHDPRLIGLLSPSCPQFSSFTHDDLRQRKPTLHILAGVSLQ